MATPADHIRDLDPDAVAEDYHRLGLDQLDDASLLGAVADVVATPKADAPNSFILHAPLEVLARATLLQHCSPGVRDLARQRMVWMAATYEHSGAPAGSNRGRPPADRAEAVARLAAAVRGGDLDGAEVAGRWLGEREDPARLGALLGDVVTPSLAAAAHGSIFLFLLPRIGARSRSAGAMLASLCRELARNPDMQLHWVDDRPPTTNASLADAVAETPVVGVPGPSFIHPVMHQVDASGLAAQVAGSALGGDVTESGRALLRLSTESMLRDDPAHAFYGWSHCLTMPQAVVSIAPALADPARALAVAATFVIGFRAALGQASLTELRTEPLPDDDGGFDLAADPSQAAAAMAAAAPHERAPMLSAVVDWAAVHPDAHLAKYVVACLEAARADDDYAHQHLAAAAYLAAKWHATPVESDPILAGSTA